MCEALDEVGPLHLGDGGVEGMLTLAGDDQTHQAGVKQHLVHHILQTCRHTQTPGGDSVEACGEHQSFL